MEPMQHLGKRREGVTTVKWLLLMTNAEFRMTNRNVRGQWLRVCELFGVNVNCCELKKARHESHEWEKDAK
ncbi:MAG: hypothetical protein JWQ71_3831 [Pedosphaera sp.]|nr:hypothetical protein [Pedosphaera sp.]